MSLKDILDLVVGLKEELTIGTIVIVILLSLIQVSKIAWNPWDRILSWIGKKLNGEILRRLETLEKQSVEDKVENTRMYILEFCNSCMYGHKHTMEQFRFILKKCDWYEAYIEERKLKNGEISSAILEIRRIYTCCIRNNSFLKEGDSDE